jgi:HlyD family secretion protein
MASILCADWYYREYYPVEAPSYQMAAVSNGELVHVITASGQINPVLNVEVGSQISGNIEKLLVDFNSPVKQGQLVAQLDAATYEANFIQAEGNLAHAKAALELAQLNAERAKALRADRLNPQADYEKALGDLHQAEASVKINEGALKKAQVDLARCTIYAPIDGVVLSRNVNVGQTVAASLSAPVLFVIANDLGKMQIDANVAEADIGQVEVGQESEFKVDAFPGKTFHGKVVQIRNAPKSDQNVVTYDTIIEVSNPELKLKPGMTANVSIAVARREKALKLPNAALRFRPPLNSLAMSGHGQAEKPIPVSMSNPKSEGSSHKKNKKKGERTVYLLSNCIASTDLLGRATKEVATFEGRQIKIGITDGACTEVLEGLTEGEEVVTGQVMAKAGVPQNLNPFVSNRKRP